MMKKGLLLIALGLVVTVGGVVAVTSIQSNTTSESQEVEQTSVTEEAQIIIDEMKAEMEGEILEIQTQLLEIENANITLENQIKQVSNELKETKKMLPTNNVGEYFVKASKLNIRKGPSADFDKIGTVEYGTKIQVIDTSNSDWYKVKVVLDGYKGSKSDYNTYFEQGVNKYSIDNDQLNDNKLVSGTEYYVKSSYLDEVAIQMPVGVPQNGKNPFVYGTIFFDKTIEKLLEAEIWTQMEPELKALGFDTVDIVPINRDYYETDLESNKYHAVESAPGQFARINDDLETMEVFAKNVIDGEENYEGVIIVNKNSGITKLEQLVGKTVLTGKKFSEGGYQYQKSYLENVKGINIEEDMHLKTDFYHQEIFYKVANGDAEVGFCSNFVLDDAYSSMKSSLERSDIILESKEELEKLRENILVIPMRGAEPIPNNPHSILKELYENEEFVDKLYSCVEKIYSNNKEDYGLTRATTREYDVLLGME